MSVAPLNAITLCVTPLCAIPLCAIPSSAAPLKCVLMNNQERKAKPEIVNVNSDEPVFYSFSIKTSKCSGSCNNINHPYTKMSRTNETRHIKWLFGILVIVNANAINHVVLENIYAKKIVSVDKG